VRTETDPGEAAMAWYPDLGLAVARVRVEALAAPLAAPLAMGDPIVPAWLRAAIT